VMRRSPLGPPVKAHDSNGGEGRCQKPSSHKLFVGRTPAPRADRCCGAPRAAPLPPLAHGKRACMRVRTPTDACMRRPRAHACMHACMYAPSACTCMHANRTFGPVRPRPGGGDPGQPRGGDKPRRGGRGGARAAKPGTAGGGGGQALPYRRATATVTNHQRSRRDGEFWPSLLVSEPSSLT
jgi:hypothetical protein